MSPDERRLLERSLRLSEENNRMLKRIDRRSRIAIVWGFVKLAVIAIPLVVGYLFLEPYFKDVAESYNSIHELISHVDMPF